MEKEKQNERASKFELRMATIKIVKARQIFDSRGNPTVEVSFNFLCTNLMHRKCLTGIVSCYSTIGLLVFSVTFVFLCFFSVKCGNIEEIKSLLRLSNCVTGRVDVDSLA